METLRDIPGYAGWRQILPVEKGWSGEKKYHIIDQSGEEYLLRVSDADSYQRKQLEFDAVKRLDRFPELVISRPLCMGRFGEKQEVYTLLTWLRGQDMETCVGKLPAGEQYQLGLEAGQALKKMHSFPAPETQPEWEKRFNAKIDRKMAMYDACPIKFRDDEALKAAIQEKRHLLKNRPQSFQHGDYHVGNMLRTPDGGVGILDFNRLDFGDPWEEFNRIPWCAQASPFFAAGRIDGYFEQKVPEEFFALLLVYIGSNQLSSVPWAIPFGQKEIGTMLQQASMVSDWYKGYTEIVPSWYRKP